MNHLHSSRRVAVALWCLAITVLSGAPAATTGGGTVPTSTFLSASKANPEPNEPITFSAHVQASIGGNPLDGIVYFNWGDGSPSVPATCVPPPLGSYCDAQAAHAFTTPGSSVVVAQYAGNVNGDPSVSDGVTETVTACSVNPVVTNSADSGAGSLRQAMADSCGYTGTNAITFDMGSVTSPITLTTGELTAGRSGVIVSGPGARTLTINRDGGAGAFRIFHALPGRDLEIRAVTISDGAASGGDPDGWGGAVLGESASITLDGVAVTNSTAENGGGVALLTFTGSPTLTITGSTISTNFANASGGGIAIRGNETTGAIAFLRLSHSTVSGNEAGATGGGVFAENRNTVTMTNVTITNNCADGGPDSGGGVAMSSTLFTTPWLRSVIVAGNYNGESVTTADDVLGFTGDGSVNNLIGGDPQLGPLADNGGQTDTHALLTGSPAIDGGNNAYASDRAFDQRGTGFGRLKDGPDADQFGTVDIGAYEADPTIEDIPDKATNEDTPLTFTFRIGDASSPTFVDLFATSSNMTLVPNDADHISVTGSGQTRTLQITPVATLTGTTTITVTYRKEVAGLPFEASDTFVLTVNDVNDTPTLDAIAPVTIDEDAGAQTVNLSGISSGAANESQGFTVTATSNNHALIPDPGVVYTSPDAAGSLSFTPAANVFGTATITVRVQDSGGTDFGAVDTAVRTFTVTVNPVADTPVASGATTNEDVQTSSGLVITRNAADGAEVPYLKITGISNGRLYLHDGTTEIHDGNWLTFDDTASGLRFMPVLSFYGTAGFSVQAGVTTEDAGLGGDVVPVTITVAPIADTPNVTDATTIVQTQTTSGLVITPSIADGPEVTHFRITLVNSGRLFLHDGTTEVHVGDFITVAAGGAGLRFTPMDGFIGTASVAAMASIGAAVDGVGGGSAVAFITVGQQPSVTTVVSGSPNPSDRLQPITVVYTVTGAPGGPVPTGGVTVSTGTLGESCSASVAAGRCTLTLNDAGPRTITAVYQGDTLTAGSTSAPLAHTVDNCQLNPAVTSLADDGGPGTLRSVVGGACVGTTIGFDVPNAPQTIVLGSPIAIEKNVRILGRTSWPVTISGGTLVPIFEVASGVTASLAGLTLADGRGTEGGAIVNRGTLRIEESLLTRNVATLAGGAITNLGTLDVLNSTLSGNTVDAGIGSRGGAIDSSGGTSLRLINVTITGNSVAGAGSGGGVQTTDTAAATTIVNSIIALNTAASDPNVGGAFIGGYNITSGDPLLGPLQDNGGTTFTHAPLAGSPALDAGDNAAVAAADLVTDQRRMTRILDAADSDTDQTVDIGAVEADPVVEVLPNVAIDEDGIAVITFNVGDVSIPFDSIVAVSGNTSLLPNTAGHVDLTGSGSTRTLALTPLANQSGSAVVTMTATKSLGLLTSATSFTLTVNAVDDPPTLDPIASPAAIAEDAGQQSVSLSGVGAGGGEVQALTVTAVSDNTALIPNPTVSYTSPNASGSLTYTPVAGKSGTATITVTVSDGHSTVAQAFTVTVTSVPDAPVVTPNLRAEEDGGSQLIRLTRNAADGSEVTHFRITSISGGTLVRNASGLPQVNSGDFLTISQGSSGLIFIPSPNSIATGHFTVEASIGSTGAALGAPVTADVVIDPVPDTPTVTPSTTLEDTQTTTGLVITRNAADGPEVSHFKILDVFNGLLFQHDGVTPIPANTVITAAQAAAGLRFTPNPNYFGGTTFLVIGVLDAAGTYNGSPGLAGGVITVSAVADTPSITGATTTVNTQTTSGLVVTRNIADGAEISFVKITGITGGSLYLSDGTTPVPNGAFVLISQAQAGLRFTPATNSAATGHVTIQAARLNTDATLGGATVTADIVVNQITSTTAVATSGSPSSPGQTVTFTATVTPALAGASGTVQFRDGSTSLGSPVTLAGGTASFSTSSLSVGLHQISAVYTGNSVATGSTGNLAGGQLVSCPAMTIAPSTVPAATAGTAYSQTFTQTGGLAAVVFSMSGTTPPGLTFTASSATLSGTPTAPGSYSFQITATPSNGCGAVSAGYTLLVGGGRALLTGADAGAGPHVRRFGALDGLAAGTLNSFFAFNNGFTGGVRVAEGDVNGDGVPDPIAGAGPGAGPEVHVYDGATGTLLRSFFAFETSFTGGVFVAAGDVNGDGFADLVAGSGPGTASAVTVLSGADLAVLLTFSPYGPFTGGVFVASGDVTGDGYADVITGAGAGGGPHVQVFDGVSGAVVRSFFALSPTFAGGVRVAAGDVTGDGKADIIAGAGPGGSPDVRVFDAVTTAVLNAQIAYPPAFTGGVFVATAVPQPRLVIERAGTAGGGGGAIAPGADRRPNMVTGWAGLEGSQDAGIAAVHVYAQPVSGGAAMFLGVATLGDPRPDVAARYGQQYANAGFHLEFGARTLPAGVYDIVVFARGTRTLNFQIARTLRVTIAP